MLRVHKIIPLSFVFLTCILIGLSSNKIIDKINWIRRRVLKKKISTNQSNNVNGSNIPSNAPSACPGVDNENAGKSKVCEGCPNQNICSTMNKNDNSELKKNVLSNLSQIKKKILILSGKGGVGKSTVSTLLCWELNKRNFKIGLLDADVCGPSIPTMTGCRHEEVHYSADGWSPVYVKNNFSVMSIGFLLPDEDDAVIWRGPKKNGLIRQFFTDVTWDDLDFLIIDTPPGTSDEHLSIVSYLTPTSIDGAIIVSTPQEVCIRDVRKEINFCKKLKIPVMGVIENMTDSIFKHVSHGKVEEMCQDMNVLYSGSLPFCKDILLATETGNDIYSINDKSIGLQYFINFTDKLLDFLKMPNDDNNNETLDSC